MRYVKVSEYFKEMFSGRNLSGRQNSGKMSYYLNVCQFMCRHTQKISYKFINRILRKSIKLSTRNG